MAEPPAAEIRDVARGALRLALSDLCARVYPGYHIAHVRCLHGGVDAATHRVDLVASPIPPSAATAADAPPRRSLILRRYGSGTLSWNPCAPERLWHILTLLSDTRLGIAAPQPLLLDATRREGPAAEPARPSLGAPTLLMSYIPGKSTLAPRDVRRFVHGLAGGLAKIHAVPGDYRGLSHLPSPADQLDRVLKAARECPELRTVPQGTAIARVLAATDGRRLVRRPVLLHGDYWAGNVLWDRGELCAVIDWDQAERGEAGYDVSYCRVDLALLFGADVADEFLHAYEQAAGGAVRDLPTWDLLAASRALPTGRAWLPGYHGLGRTDLDERTTAGRLHAFLDAAIARAAA